MYVVYNIQYDKFLDVVHDEAQWVDSAHSACVFSTSSVIFDTVGTLIGKYPRNKALKIMDQMNYCIVVPVEIHKSGVISDVHYDEFLELSDIRND